MAFLEQFSEQERDLIVSIPYRAGVWVSQVDETGGAEANYEELSQLENIISKQAQGMFESAFVHEVMAETFARQPDWKTWAGSLDDLLGDCSRAVKIISGKLSEKDVDAYRSNILGIGLDVAKAFREFGADESALGKLQIKIKLLCDGLARVWKRDRSYDQASALNISLEEDAALTKLSKALHPVLDEQGQDAQISKS